jgi:Asp/Glu/hydantoin racemase
MKNQLAMVHATTAAIAALTPYYRERAPDIEVLNLLDEGLQRFFAAGDDDQVYARLSDMIAMAARVYGARASLVTCSAVSPAVMARLREALPIPVVKIDEPLAAAAVRAGNRIGAIISYAPTERATLSLIERYAALEHKTVEVSRRVVPEALAVLLSGDRERHDRLLSAAAEELAAEGCDTLLLAQVSMAHLQEPLERKTGLPVFESLSRSLEAVRREMLGRPGAVS